MLISCLLGSQALAQISAGGEPVSITRSITSQPPSVSMPAVDAMALVAEDEAEQVAAAPLLPPLRIAAGHEVNLNLNNSGLWETLPTGERVWRLRIECPGANAMYFWFNEWNIPKGGRLFVYNDSRTDIRGAFTHENNWHEGTNIIAPVPGGALTLEYNLDAGLEETGQLSIGRVLHVYRRVFEDENALDNFGDAQSCNININCPEGNNWQDEKRAVAMIVSGGGRLCTGTMVRSLCNDFDPLFMTADHCIDGNQANWVYIFNYEAAGCPNPGSEPSTAQSVSNSTHLMSWPLGTGSDMALLRLSSAPPPSYNHYIAGWDRNNVAQTSTVGIHHTDGDIKKIYGDNNTAVSDQWTGTPNTHWKIEWDYGAMCYGASGSGAWDQNSRLKGPLTGGYPCCNNAGPDEAWYGKISLSWTGGGTPATRLSDWLDPCGNGSTTTNGIYPPIASNDNCNTAYYVGYGTDAFPFSHASNTTGATNDYGATCRTFPGPDLVYYWYSGCCSTAVTVSVCGAATWDTGIYVRRDSCNGTEVACNDDACSSLQSEATFNAEPGKIYYFFIDGYSATSFGAYTLNITGASLEPAVTNDHCTSPILINSLPYSHASNTCTAVNSRTNCVGPTSRDVFYTLNLATCQTVTVTTCGSTCFDTAIEVLTGGSCPGTTQVACNDDNYCGGDFTLRSTVTFDAVAGQNYYIVLHGFSTSAGRYQLDVTGVPFTPPGDDCSTAIVIPTIPYSVSGDTRCAQNNFSNCVGSLSRDIVYNYVSPFCQQITLTTCDANTNYDTAIEVRTEGACPGAVRIACNDDDFTCNLNGLYSRLTFDAAENQTYYFIVHGFSTNAGAYTLNISANLETPSNDDCAGAKGIFSLPYVDIGSTSCAADHNYGTCAVISTPDVVYRMNVGSFYLTPCAVVNVSLCGSSYDTRLEVRSDGACPGTTMVACNDDSYCSGTYTLQSTVTFAATAATDYWIIVYSWSNNQYGPYRIEANIVCDPDSLVVQRQGNDIYLDWAPVAETSGTINYKVYRAATPDVPLLPGNVIATVNTPYYTDAGAVGNPADRFFYAVTTDATYPLTDPPGEGAIASLDGVPPVETPQKDGAVILDWQAMPNVLVPAYIDPADMEGPNPNKTEMPR